MAPISGIILTLTTPAVNDCALVPSVSVRSTARDDVGVPKIEEEK